MALASGVGVRVRTRTQIAAREVGLGIGHEVEGQALGRARFGSELDLDVGAEGDAEGCATSVHGTDLYARAPAVG